MDPEEIKDEILSRWEEVASDLADASAAQAWSTPSDADVEEHGEGLLIVAYFGSWTAENGDLVLPDQEETDLRTYHEVPGGGRIPAVEEEVYRDFIVRGIQNQLREELEWEVAEAFIETVLKEEGVPEYVYLSVSGDAEFYVPD